VAAAFVLRWILLRYTFTQAMNKLDEKDLKPYIEWYDFIQIGYYFRFAKAALVKTKYRWD